MNQGFSEESERGCVVVGFEGCDDVGNVVVVVIVTRVEGRN